MDASGGEARVELLDADTRVPLPGYSMDEAVPVRGDHITAEAVWREKPGMAALIGRRVLIRVSLREAALFSLVERLA